MFWIFNKKKRNELKSSDELLDNLQNYLNSSGISFDSNKKYRDYFMDDYLNRASTSISRNSYQDRIDDNYSSIEEIKTLFPIEYDYYMKLNSRNDKIDTLI